MLVSGETRERCHPRRQKAGLRGDYEGNRNTIAAGNAGMSGVTAVTTPVCFLPLHAGLRRYRRPAFPAPSFDLRDCFGIARARICAAGTNDLCRRPCERRDPLSSMLMETIGRPIYNNERPQSVDPRFRGDNN